MSNITVEKLAADLRAIGLQAGDDCYVHTSMKTIGWLANGPQTLYDALTAVLGTEGTLLAPAHSLNFTHTFTGEENVPYDGINPATTGGFPNFMLKHPAMKRSGSATHSSVATGRRAEFYTASHDVKNAMGEDSPLSRLYKRSGKVLLIGVGHNTNTMLHLAEQLAVGYVVTQAYPVLGTSALFKEADGSVREVEQETFPGDSSAFTLMDGFFKYHGISSHGYIGSARSQLLDAAQMVDMTIHLLKEKPDFLLCPPGCAACDVRRENIKPRR
jgi:aminoglycoside 3-N-acetyltransferase